MRGVICAGGAGERLMPLTTITNKHLLPVYDRPMILYAVETLVKAGIKEIMIVTGGPHAGGFLHLLGDGREYGIEKLFFGYQKKPRGGIADALSCAESFANGEPIVVILGDNIFSENIERHVNNFCKNRLPASVFLKRVPDPHRFGVAEIQNGKVISLEEKPLKPKTNLAAVGLYMYDQYVFRYLKKLKPSKRGELEITDLNKEYMKDNGLHYSIIDGYWGDCGTFESLHNAATYIRKTKE